MSKFNTDDFPKLPEGYRWAVFYSRAFGSPRVVARIFRKGLLWDRLVAEGRWYLSVDSYKGLPEERAAEDAYSAFVQTEDKWENRLRRYTDALNKRAHA